MTQSLLPYVDMVWPTTNEFGQNETQNVLKENPPIHGKNAVFGCSGYLVLNLASLHPEIEHVAIFDVSKRVQDFWKETQKILENPELNFIETKLMIMNYLSEFELEDQRLQRECELDLSFLSSPERLQRIRKIFQEHRFSFTLLNLGDPQAFRAFLETRHQAGEDPYLIYTSNIASAPPGMGNTLQSYHRFCQSIHLIPQDTIIVDSEKGTDDECATQKVYLPPQRPEIVPNQNVLYSYILLDEYAAVTQCLNDGADPNRKYHGIPLINEAARLGLYNSVCALIDSGKVDLKRVDDETGHTALHACVTDNPRNASPIIQYLVNRGHLSVHETDRLKFTPIDLAFHLGRDECVSVLQSLGAERTLDVNEDSRRRAATF